MPLDVALGNEQQEGYGVHVLLEGFLLGNVGNRMLKQLGFWSNPEGLLLCYA